MKSLNEDKYLEAEKDIKDGNILDAKQKYEAILYEEPDSAAVHNSLGWIYKTQFDNYEKARLHYHAAILAEPLYPHPYLNLTYLLWDLESWEDLNTHLHHSLNVPTCDKFWIYERFGMIEEKNKNYKEAIRFYKESLKFAFTDEKIEEGKKNLLRVEYKRGI